MRQAPQIPVNKLLSLSKQDIVGWKLTESQYRDPNGPIYTYLKRISKLQRESFGEPKRMIEKSLEGYDLHIMVMVEEGEENYDENSINGLVIFKQEAIAFKNTHGTSTTRILIHHVSPIFEEQRQSVFDLTLEYIWKHTHCSAIRLN